MGAWVTLTEEDVSRFWSKVLIVEDEDSCWPWLAGKFDNGYGSFRASLLASDIGAHRLSHFMAVGELFKEQLGVLHTCDFKPCVRPSHLYQATQQQNIADSIARGRFPVGETHGMSKLSSVQVSEIRALYEAGNLSQRQLGVMYGTSQSNIYYIVNNLTRVRG